MSEKLKSSESLMLPDTNRLDWIDSIKGILILMVVCGHITAGENSLVEIQILRYLIYAFDMPMFILITGLFSKKNRNFRHILSAYLIPYVLFDGIYVIWCLIIGKDANLLILTPTFVFWYLLCIAIQKLMLRYIHPRFLIVFIVAVIQIGSLYISEQAWRFLSLGRVGLLFPVFYIGYLIPFDMLIKFRMKKILPLLLGILCLGIVLLLYKIRIVPISATHNYYTSLPALGVKYVYMIATLGLFLCLNSVIPKGGILNKWGSHSLIIFLFHPYFTDVIGYAVRHYISSDVLSVIIELIAAVGITAFLSLDFLKNIYDSLMQRINAVFNLTR